MRNVSIFALLLLASIATPTSAAPWQPAKGPLMTRWAKDVTPEKALPEYPRPQLVRADWKTLNGLWQLQIAKADDAVPLGKDLPEQILVPFPVESALSGVMQHADHLFYRRMFEVPADWKGKRTLLHFGAVDWEATVYVNGQKLLTHQGGYDGFTLDITDALKPQAQQELVVAVFDPTDAGSQPRGKQVNKPGGIFYTPTTGIWQTVWLEAVPENYIKNVKIVPDVDHGSVTLTIEAAGKDMRTGAVKILDGERVVAEQAGVEVGHPFSVKIPEPKLWSPSEPFLYDLHITLGSNDKGPGDTITSYFGMRKIEVAKDDRGRQRLRLNGKFLFQMGPLDQGFWPDGLYTAPTDEALRYDIEITKKLGFNMTRKHVKVEPERWYYWCDKLGLLVWQDMPSGDNKTPESKQQYEHELTRLVEGRGNHPSIVMWVVFNEGWGQFDTERLTKYVKDLDPSRLVNNASGWTDKLAGDVMDIHSYPGPGAPPAESQRASVLGEFGGLGLGVDGHTWTNKTWGYKGTASGEELTARYLSLLRNVWKLKESAGLSAAVYTQITDVETEANGLLTYDREVIKVDLPRVAAANRGELSPLKVLAPTAQDGAVEWHYTLEKPADDWFKTDFDVSGWKIGKAGFGSKGTPGAIIGTEWTTNNIWLRREFDVPNRPLGELSLSVHHDDDVEIYINGVLAAKADGYVSDYGEMTMTAEAQKAIKTGKNVLAVHCLQHAGGQFIDVGVTEIPPVKPAE